MCNGCFQKVCACVFVCVCVCVCETVCSTHPSDISRPELNRAEQAQDDDDDVEEVGQDGSPLVAKEIYHLTFEHADLGGGEGGRD